MRILVSSIVAKAWSNWTVSSNNLSDRLSKLLVKGAEAWTYSEKARVLAIFGVMDSVTLQSHHSPWPCVSLEFGLAGI